MDGKAINENFAKTILEKLDEIKTFSKNYFTVQEAAIYVGCSEDTIRRYMRGGDLAYSKPAGKRVFISRKDLEDFIFNGRTPSKREIDSQASNYMISRR